MRIEKVIEQITHLKNHYADMALMCKDEATQPLRLLHSFYDDYYTALSYAECALEREQPKPPVWGGERQGYYKCRRCGEYVRVTEPETFEQPPTAANRYCAHCGQRLRE